MTKNIFDFIYEPHDDSDFLLDTSLEHLEKSQKNKMKICEVGVGSGYVIGNIARKYKDKFIYFGTDINPGAISYTKKFFNRLEINIDLKETNLLDDQDQLFDLIIFNTPYLPCEKDEDYKSLSLKDRAIYGGKKGYEVIEKFIYQINDKLKENGAVLMLFSSHSNLKYIEELLEKNKFEFKIIKEKQIFFETLYVMKIQKSEFLKSLSQKNIKNIKYFTKGKHSYIFDGTYNNDKIIIKYGEEKDLQIESMFLEKLQDQLFVPVTYLKSKNYVIMEKIIGKTIKNYLEKETDKEDIIKVLNKILEITQTLDKLKINKFELTNPYKHIFISKHLGVKFIDFERCLYTEKPKNTTQFLTYIRKQIPLFKTKGINISAKKILEISKKHKSKKIKKIQIKDILV